MGLLDLARRIATTIRGQQGKQKAFDEAERASDFFESAKLWNEYVTRYLVDYHPSAPIEDADHLPPLAREAVVHSRTREEMEVITIRSNLRWKLNTYFSQEVTYDPKSYNTHQRLTRLVSLDDLEKRVVSDQVKEWDGLAAQLSGKGNLTWGEKSIRDKAFRTRTTCEAYGKIRGIEKDVVIPPRVYVDDARRLSGISTFYPENKSEFNQAGVQLFDFYFRRFYDEGRLERYDALVRSLHLDQKDRNSRSFHNIVGFMETVENLDYSGLQELANYLDEQGVQTSSTPQSFGTRVAQVRTLLEQQMETVNARYLAPAIEYMKTSLKHFEKTKGGEGNQHRLGYYKELCTFFGTEFSSR